MDLLQTLLALLLTLGILVTVHEAGHYFLARYFGVRVLRFSLGMGPVVWHKKNAEGTEFALSLLPLGGYVKMLEEDAPGVTPAPRQESFSSKHPAARIAIALGGPVANLLLAVLVYWVLFLSGVTGLVPYLRASGGGGGSCRGRPAHGQLGGGE
jgi:regulator of sigma E protease